MMKITVIKQQIKNPQRVSIFVDERYSFSLSLDELVKCKLKKDQELSASDVKKYKKLSQDGKLRSRALEWTLNRPHSIREFKDYMYRKKASPELTESLIKEFNAKNYLNEQKFGQWFLDLQKRRGKSNRAIRSDFFKKGLDREMIEELMQDQSESEQQRLKDLIAKKRKASRYRDDPQKLAQYLVAQGFNWQDVKKALAMASTED